MYMEKLKHSIYILVGLKGPYKQRASVNNRYSAKQYLHGLIFERSAAKTYEKQSAL